jgi:hypothetical protein
MSALPKLVAFDLDDTLRSPEMWLCSGAPFSDRAGRVYDCSGVEIALIGDSRAILHELATEVSVHPRAFPKFSHPTPACANTNQPDDETYCAIPVGTNLIKVG